MFSVVCATFEQWGGPRIPFVTSANDLVSLNLNRYEQGFCGGSFLA